MLTSTPSLELRFEGGRESLRERGAPLALAGWSWGEGAREHVGEREREWAAAHREVGWLAHI